MTAVRGGGLGPSRRTFLAGGLGLAAVGLLAGCDTVTRSTDIKAINKAVALPDYVPWKGGPEPVLPKTSQLMPSAFRAVPGHLVPTKGTPGDGSTIRGTVPTNGPIPPAIGQNQYLQGLDERLGASLRLTITPGADYANKFSTSVAGDTLGDVFNVVSSFAYLPQFLEAKAQDLTGYLSGDAVRDYPYLANLPTASWRGCVYSGGIYALPCPRGPLTTQQILQRGDLCDELGVDPSFGSVDELMQVLRDVTDARRNRWGIASVPTNELGAMFGVPNQWAEDDGRLTSMYETDEYQDMLEVERKMIAAGVVHPDSVTAYNGKVWFNQGSAVMIADTYSAIPGLLQQNTSGDDYRIDIAKIPGPGGAVAKQWLGDPNNSVTALAKASPERIRMLLDVMNWCASPFGTDAWMFRKFGIEGRDFEFRGGAPVLTKTGNSETALGEYPLQYFTECPLPLFYSGYPEMTDAVYESLASWLDDGIPNPVYGLYSPTNSTKGPAVGAFVTNAINDVLLGRAPVSGWKDVVRDWRRRGGSAIRDEYERALAARSA